MTGAKCARLASRASATRRRRAARTADGVAAQVGASQIVLGSDYPYPWQLKPVDHIFACDSLSDEQKVAVLGGTAAKLLNING